MLDKNKKKENAKANRVWWNMNTGTITHKDKRKQSRKKVKENLKNHPLDE